MPNFTKNYSEINDFPTGEINTSRFDKEIRASGIVAPLKGVDQTGDVITVKFTIDPTSADMTILDGDTSSPAGGLIAAHVIPAPPIGIAYVNSEGENNTTSTTLKLIATLDTSAIADNIGHHIRWYCEVNNSNKNGKVEVEIAYDGTVIALPSMKSRYSTGWAPFSGFFHLPAGIVPSEITLKFRRISSGTASVRRSRLEIHQIIT